MRTKNRVILLLLGSIWASTCAQATQTVVPLPVQVRLETPGGLSADSSRPATLVIRPLPGSSLSQVQALAIDPVDADVQLSNPMPALTIEPSDSRFRSPFAFRISQIQTELRIPLSIRPQGREASALEIFFLTLGENASMRIAFQTLVVLEKTGASRYETTSEPAYLKRRMEATSHADPLRSTSRKHRDASIEERTR
jgi:hypothetical protein